MLILFNCDILILIDLDKLKEELETLKQEVKDLLEDKEMLTKKLSLKDDEINMLNHRLDRNKP